MTDRSYKSEHDYGFDRRVGDLCQVVAYELEHPMIEGVAERAESQSTSVGVALGRLVEILHRKGLLTLEEAGEVVESKIIEVGPDGEPIEVPAPEPEPRKARRPRTPGVWPPNSGESK